MKEPNSGWFVVIRDASMQMPLVQELEASAFLYLQAPSAQQQGLTVSTEAAVGFGLTLFGALIVGSSKFLFDQAVERWQERLDEMRADISKLEPKLESDIAKLELKIEKKQEVSPKQIEILEQRLANLGGALQDTQKLFQDAQRDLIKLRGEMSADYVRREDWVRFSSTLEAKMDALNRKLEDRFETLVQRIGQQK